jgi:hypothetical protein
MIHSKSARKKLAKEMVTAVVVEIISSSSVFVDLQQ